MYTDTWVSMGQESETEDRVSDFAPYQINPSLFSKAKDDAVLCTVFRRIAGTK